MPENINYDEDILIYPITGNLSDITSSNIVTSKSISIHFLNLTNAYGIAIFDPIENRLIHSDNLQYNDTELDGTNLIFTGNGIDISVWCFDTFEYILSDATNITFSAYLYNIDRKRISNIITKTISITYSNTLNYIGYVLDIEDVNYTLDGTFTNNEILTFPPDSYLEIKHTYGKLNKYIDDPYYNGCLYNTSIVPSTSSDFILTLINDSNNTYSILNTIEATLYDATGSQISPTLNKDIKVKRLPCIIPSMSLSVTNTSFGSSFQLSAASANSGGVPNCFSNLIYFFGVKINEYSPAGALQQLQTLPIFYKNATLHYSTSNNPSFTLKSKANYKTTLTPQLLLNYKPSVWDEDELGTLTTNDTTVSFSNNDSYIVCPCYIADYDPSSILLKFTSPDIDLYKFTNYKQYLLYKLASSDTTLTASGIFNTIEFDSIDINYNYAEGTGTYYEYVDFDNRVVGSDYNATVYGTDIFYNSVGGYYRPWKSSNLTIYRNPDGVPQLNLNKLHHYSYYMNLTSCSDREMPFMMYIESNTKIHVLLTGGELDLTNDSTTDSTTDSTIDGTDSTSGIPYITILDFIVEAGVPYQLRESSTVAMLFSPTITNHIYIQAVEDMSLSEINVSFLLSPCFNNYIYVKKDSDFLNTLNATNSIDTIEYALLVADHPYTPKYYGGLSTIRSLTLDYNNVNIVAQNPIAKYDKILNTYGDIALTMAPFVGTPITTYSTLHMRVLETINSPSDWTDISSVNVGDIIHVFGFGFNKSYYMEYYITPNDGSVSSTPIEKITFKTAIGTCGSPTVTQDATNGSWRVTCGSTCRPAYRYADAVYPNRTYSTIANVNYQYNYSSFNEAVLLNGETEEYFNVYGISNDSTTCFKNEVGLAAKRADARFEFMCIGSLLYTLGNTAILYYSPKVTIAENYPWASLVQPTLYVFTGTTSTKIYRNNYGRWNENGTNPGTPNACILYRKNGSATLINGGTSYYITVSMNINDTIEVKQTDLNGLYGQSWSLFGKRLI